MVNSLYSLYVFMHVCGLFFLSFQYLIISILYHVEKSLVKLLFASQQQAVHYI